MTTIKSFCAAKISSERNLSVEIDRATTKRGGQLVDTPIGVNTRIGFRKAPPVHQRRFAFVAGFGYDRHQANCRAFVCNSEAFGAGTDADVLRTLSHLSDRRLRLGFFHYRRADWLAFFDELDLAMLSEAGSGRDQVTHDHVFLKATQFIDFAQCRRFGENAGRVLE